MGNVCVYGVFGRDREPLVAGYYDAAADRTEILDIYAPGSGLTLAAAAANRDTIRNIVVGSLSSDVTVVTSDFKAVMHGFDLPCVAGADYNVYDVCWPAPAKTPDTATARSLVGAALTKLATVRRRAWQRLSANAAVVYQALERRGVLVGGLPRYPVWSQATYSGRSKNLVVNIQGADGNDLLTNPDGGDVFVHLDWRAADLMIASIVSGDAVLRRMFEGGDPYTALSAMLTDTTGSISRADCKLSILRAINSLDCDHPLLREVFVSLRDWLVAARTTLAERGCLQSVLGRKFTIAGARANNELAVLNGVFQGSVAHAMHAVIKKIWDRYGQQLLVEMHDSIVMTATPATVKQIVDDVAGMMTRPFRGLLDDDHFFPLRVSIGPKFRGWRPTYIYHRNGVERVADEQTEEDTSEPEEESGAPGAIGQGGPGQEISQGQLSGSGSR